MQEDDARLAKAIARLKAHPSTLASLSPEAWEAIEGYDGPEISGDMKGKMTSLLETALAYAARGIPILPIMEGAKLPATKRGLKDRTCDTEQIRHWFAVNPNYNLAIVPEDAGWCVVDLDQGSEWTDTTTTYTVRTPSGGRHLYFQGSLRPTVGKLGAHIDTRGVESYVLVPPSRIIDTEKGINAEYAAERINAEYAAERINAEYTAEHMAATALLPEWIVEAIGTATEIRAADGDIELDTYEALRKGAEFIRGAEQATQGNASDLFYRQAARLLDFGISEAAACDLIKQRNPGYELWDIANRVGNARRHRQNEIGSDAPRPLDLVPDGYKAEIGEPAKPGDPLPLSGATAPPDVQVDEFECAADSDPIEYDWLWDKHYIRGALHLLAGKGSVGKSTIMVQTCATITSGGLWPDGSRAPVGDCIIWSAEDDWKRTIVPRFMIAGGDRKRFFRVPATITADGKKRSFNLAQDVDALMRKMRARPECKYLGLDPLSVIVGSGKGASNNDAEVRTALLPLLDLAEERGIVVEGIMHFTKESDKRDWAERINGSGAFVNVSRVSHAVQRIDGANCEWGLIKFNLSEGGGIIGRAYRIENTVVPGFPTMMRGGVVWGDPITNLTKIEHDSAPKMAAAMTWVVTILSQNGGSMLSDEMDAACKKDGEFSIHTMANARRELKKLGRIVDKQNLGAQHGGWRWDLPEVLDAAQYEPVSW